MGIIEEWRGQVVMATCVTCGGGAEVILVQIHHAWSYIVLQKEVRLSLGLSGVGLVLGEVRGRSTGMGWVWG